MSIFCLGVNHKTAPVEIRERLAFAEKAIPNHLDEIREIDPIEEAVVLSTCNRVEIYGSAADPKTAVDLLVDYLVDHFEVQHGEVEFYQHEAEQAAHHLFEVASGLDSMVLARALEKILRLCGSKFWVIAKIKLEIKLMRIST